MGAGHPFDREVTIVRREKGKSILAFSAPIQIGTEERAGLDGLAPAQKDQLIQEIIIYFTGKDVGYESANWPLDKLAIEHVLPLDNKLTGYLVDLRAKEVINGVIGGRSIIRKAIMKSISDKEDSQT